MAVSAFAMPPVYGTPSDAYTLLEFNTVGSGDIDFGRIRYGNTFPAASPFLRPAFVRNSEGRSFSSSASKCETTQTVSLPPLSL